MEAIRSSKMSVHTRATRRNIREVGIVEITICLDKNPIFVLQVSPSSIMHMQFAIQFERSQ
jgi:hypothetical protein